MESTSAVQPPGVAARRRFSKLPIFRVNSACIPGRSAHFKNSASSRLSVTFNRALTSERAVAILGFMLPLTSSTMPIDAGSSSVENATIGCGTPSSKTRNRD